MLEEARKYGQEWGVKFSGTKCKVMLFGDAINEGWVLGNEVLEVVEEYKYLGVTLSSKGDLFGRHKRGKELGMLRMLGMLKNVMTKHAGGYLIVRELWKGVGVPRSLYGYEVCKVSKEEIDKMEKMQNRVARLGLGANSYTAVEALRGEMGWSRYQERIAKMKIRYKIKLQELSNRDEMSWAGYLYKLEGSDWAKEIRRIERKYELDRLYGAENSRVLVERRITEHGQIEWERGLNSKSTLRFYRNKKAPRREEFYDGSYEGKLLFRARAGSLEVNARTHRWNGGSESCEKCYGGMRETIEYVIVECEGYRDERECLSQEIGLILGQDRWEAIRDGESQGVSLILGFECGDKRVDRCLVEIVEKTKKFFKNIWKIRGGN